MSIASTEGGSMGPGELLPQSGLYELVGQRVTLFCLNYIYTGQLTTVSADSVYLQDPAIVYETGAFTDSTWKDAQKLPQDIYVMRACIESFGLVK